ncbi:hypothetical protein [Helicobacter pylori]|uniref:hypothetical protein n=1 Tax=Helicobacter pylori TaxID=210 RepID=UPI001968B887|nr:hypothetical protein [Helicobacter pylori]
MGRVVFKKAFDNLLQNSYYFQKLFLEFVVIVPQAKIKVGLIVTLFRRFVGGF